MKIIKISKNKTKNLKKVKDLLSDICADLKKEDAIAEAFKIKLDLNELIHKLSE